MPCLSSTRTKHFSRSAPICFANLVWHMLRALPGPAPIVDAWSRKQIRRLTFPIIVLSLYSAVIYRRSLSLSPSFLPASRRIKQMLADTIGKIAVQCLYHMSGCKWKGSLSECSSHCSGCGFGNSPVVCNRCDIQIEHRQVMHRAVP